MHVANGSPNKEDLSLRADREKSSAPNCGSAE